MNVLHLYSYENIIIDSLNSYLLYINCVLIVGSRDNPYIDLALSLYLPWSHLSQLGSRV